MSTTVIDLRPNWPAGAADVRDWRDAARRFYGTERTSNGWQVPVSIVGEQYRDGRVDRRIVVCEGWDLGELDTEQARQLAADLLAAADEIDRLTS